MATDRNTSSVLAKLMGIDRLLPSHKPYGRRIVFSENYLRNVASVIHLEKSVLGSDMNYFSMDVGDDAECEETVEYSKGASVDGHYSLVSGDYNGDSRMKNKLNNTHLQQRRTYHNIDMGIFSGSTYKKQETVFCVRNKGLGLQKGRMNNLHHNGMKSHVRENVSPKEIAKQITNQVNHSVWHTCLTMCKSEGRVDNSNTDDLENKCELSPSNPSKRSDSRNTKKIKKACFESWRARKYSQEVRTYHGRKTLDERHVACTQRSNYALKDVNSCVLVNANGNHCRVGTARFLSNPTLFPSAWVPRNKERRFTLDQNWISRPEHRNSNFSNKSLEDNVDDTSISLEMLPVNDTKPSRHLDNKLSTCDFAHPTVNTEKFNLGEGMGMCSKLEEKTLPVHSSKNIVFDDVAPCEKDYVLIGELKRTISSPRSPVSSLEGPEGCLNCLNCTVKTKDISITRCLHDDVLGLQTKLQLIEAVSIESGYEGPGMAVSSDASDGGGSTCCYREDAQIPEYTSESRDFSYLVDVLIESGMMTGNIEMERGRWYSGNYVLDPSVFDSLENKYGKSTAMERSERRLLFDRINSGLMEIFWPSVGILSWRKPVVKRLSARRSHKFVEEDLWDLLVNQTGFNRDLQGKVCGGEVGWLDLEEHVDFMVQEIQCLLIDELLEEFVSLESVSR